MGKPRDGLDAARDLVDIAGQLGSMKGEAHTWLRGPDYNALMLRLVIAHAAVEAAVVEAEGAAERGARTVRW